MHATHIDLGRDKAGLFIPALKFSGQGFGLGLIREHGGKDKHSCGIRVEFFTGGLVLYHQRIDIGIAHFYADNTIALPPEIISSSPGLILRILATYDLCRRSSVDPIQGIKSVM